MDKNELVEWANQSEHYKNAGFHVSGQSKGDVIEFSVSLAGLDIQRLMSDIRKKTNSANIRAVHSTGDMLTFTVDFSKHDTASSSRIDYKWLLTTLLSLVAYPLWQSLPVLQEYAVNITSGKAE